MGNKGDNSVYKKSWLMIILCRARKIKAMTYAKVKGNKFFEKICNVIRAAGFHIIRVNVNKILKIIFLEHKRLENFRAKDDNRNGKASVCEVKGP